MYLSSSSLKGTGIRNTKNEDLGSIEDLMINTSDGQVEYAVVSFGGFLGIGDKFFAVPLQAFTVDTINEELILNESKERLKSAPGFDKENWPKSPDSRWAQEVRSFYKV